MIGLLQRVSTANVSIEGRIVAQISTGLLVLIGIRPLDTLASGTALLQRLLKYRVFADAAGKMNLSLQQVGGELLLVPQFTLAADTRHGLRPGFSTAAPPAVAAPLFETLVQTARGLHPAVQSGVFGADMLVSLTNDGPVTLWLDTDS